MKKIYLPIVLLFYYLRQNNFKINQYNMTINIKTNQITNN